MGGSGGPRVGQAGCFGSDSHPIFVCVPQRQQVSLLAQRLSGGPAVSDMQNHLLAGSGQVSGVSRGSTGVSWGCQAKTGGFMAF